MSLLQQLSTLENANLIRLAATQPELEYLFRHALMQETVYHSFVRADRRLVHRLVGECLEQLHAGRTDLPELAPQLARHFDEANEPARALPYYTLAADAAMARYALNEAIALLSRALACAQKVTAGADTWQHLYTARGRALELNAQHDQALANYQAMGEQARERGDRPTALAALILEGQLYSTPTPLFNPARAECLAETALLEARALGDRPAEAKVLWTQLNSYRFTRRMRLALASGERSLAIARELGLSEQLALTLNDMVHVYAQTGQWPAGKAAAAEVGGLWRRLGNLPMLADSLATSALYGTFFGEIDASLGRAAEAHQLSVTIGNLWGQAYSLSNMAWGYWYRGDPGRALEADEEAIRLSGLAGYGWPRIMNRTQQAFVYRELGDARTGLALAREALDWAEHSMPQGRTIAAAALALAEVTELGPAAGAARLETIPPDVHNALLWEIDPVMRTRTALALAEGNMPRALQAAEEHVALLRSFGLRLFLPEALLSQARCLLRLGRPAEAGQSLAQARAEAQALGARMAEWQVLLAQGDMAAAAGRPAEAQQLWADARDIVTAIAQRVPAPELRRSFLLRAEGSRQKSEE